VQFGICLRQEKSSFDLKQLTKDNFFSEVFFIELTISGIILFDKKIFSK
jgi:hypothetical protein